MEDKVKGKRKQNKPKRGRQIRILYVNSRAMVMVTMMMMMPGNQQRYATSDAVGTNALFKAKRKRRGGEKKKRRW